MPRLIILGSGTPEPTPERWGTSFLLELDGEWLMVDCGPAATYKMLQMGICPTEINHLFFTHYHSDHISDYPCFLMTRFERSVGREADLRVYGPPPIKAMTEKIWGRETGAFWSDVVARTQHPMSIAVFHGRGGQGPRLEPTVHVQEYQAGLVGEGPHWTCTALEIDHAQPYLGCYGLRFETDEGVIVFSGDASPNTALAKLAQDADLMLMAVMGKAMIRGEALGAKLAQDAGVKRLVITHQAPSLTQTDNIVNEAIYDIKQAFQGAVYWGKDMMEIIWD